MPKTPATAGSWTKLIRNEIGEFIKQQNYYRPFVKVDKLRQIWQKVLDNRDINVDGSVKKHRETILSHDGRHLLVALTVLISVGWSEWDQIDKVLLDREGRCLYTLPMTREQANCFHWEFYDKQFTYLPVTIVHDESTQLKEDELLPFTEREEFVDSGSTCTVTKVIIAPGSFAYRGEHTKAITHKNSEPKVLARKKFSSVRAAEKELAILKKMRNNLSNHKHILQHLCTIEIQHRRELSILSDFADGGNLDTFLDREDLDHIKNAHLIIEQATHLADALDWLHRGIRTKKHADGGYSNQPCYHMDLKPANILIFRNSTPVGHWKITDFGLSVLHEVIQNASESGASRTPGKRPPGAFQAPEVQEGNRDPAVNAETDIWSYGGILCMILAYTVGGFKRVDFVENLRAHTPTGQEDDDRFWEPGEREPHNPWASRLKPQIDEWLHLTAKATRKDEHYLQYRVIRTVRNCLTIKRKQRPTAKCVRDALDEACSKGSSPPSQNTISDTESSHDSSLLPALSIPPKKAKATVSRLVPKHLRTSSETGPDRAHLSAPVSKTPRNLSDTPNLLTPSTSSSRAAPRLSMGPIKSIENQSSTKVKFVSMEQNADCLLFASSSQVKIYYAQDDKTTTDYTAGQSLDVALDCAYLGGACLLGYKWIKKDRSFLVHWEPLKGADNDSLPSLENATDSFKSAELTTVSRQGNVVLMQGGSLSLFERSQIPIPYVLKGKDVFKTIAFNKSGDQLLACSVTRWFRWSVDITGDESGSQHWFSKPEHGTFMIQDWRDPKFWLLPLQTRGAFLIYDNPRIQMYDATSRQARDKAPQATSPTSRKQSLEQSYEQPHEVVLSTTMICWCLSSDDQDLLYIRQHNIPITRFRSAVVYAIFRRPIYASSLGDEKHLFDLEDFDPKEKISMAFHEHKLSSKLIVFSVTGKYQVFTEQINSATAVNMAE